MIDFLKQKTNYLISIENSFFFSGRKRNPFKGSGSGNGNANLRNILLQTTKDNLLKVDKHHGKFLMELCRTQKEDTLDWLGKTMLTKTPRRPRIQRYLMF